MHFCYLQLKLVGTVSNRDAIGSRVRVIAGGREQVDEVRSAYSYASANDLRLHFGLGRATEARVIIEWISGRRQELKLPANRIVTVREP